MVGRGDPPKSLVVRPDRPTGGTPGPSAPGATLEVTLVFAKSTSAPNSNSERSKPVSVAGFQNRAPAGLKGAAVEAPPIERWTAPAPGRTVPNWAFALLVATAR